MEKLKTSSDLAREYVEGFQNWLAGAKIAPDFLDAYEKTFSIEMPIKEWAKFSEDFNILENDQKSVAYLQDYSR